MALPTLLTTDLRRRSGVGDGPPPAGSGGSGDEYWDYTNLRLYLHDGSSWILASWSATSRPGVTLTDATQSIASGTITDITWGTEVLDFDGWTSGGSATLTVPAGHDGLYVVTYLALWATSGLGATTWARMLWNGGARAEVDGPVISGCHTLTFTRPLAAGDTLKFQVYQSSGGAVNTDSALWVARIGA